MALEDIPYVIEHQLDLVYVELNHLRYHKKKAIEKLRLLRTQEKCDHDFQLVELNRNTSGYDLYTCTKCKYDDYRRP